MFRKISKQVPVVGLVIGFGFTAMDVYNSTTPMGIVISCIPPLVKDPILCTEVNISGVAVVATGFSPVSISILVNTMRLIVEA